jgi:CRISPR-associated protein Cmr6
MSISAPPDTRNALGPNFAKCDSRSLWVSRFADPTAKDDDTATPRKDWFKKLCAKAAQSPLPSGGGHWAPSSAHRVLAQLKSRLLVNKSGGVMENANVCLNRYGLPVIPGSAVKGCARRAALATLREWTETGTRPSGADNLLSPLCENFQQPYELLVQICLVFGWVELDWKPKLSPKKPDFEWASGNDFQPVWKAAALALCAKLGVLPSGRQADSPWNELPNYAGSIAFLEAVPNRDPGLELDVLTSHHPDYYNPEKAQVNIATDTENPVPVLFPAVKEQTGSDYFEFRLVPMRRATRDDLSFAKMALQVGLETFGLGGKTNAGYGWFDVPELTEYRNRAAEIEAERAKESERLEQESKSASLRLIQPDPALLEKFGKIKPDQLRGAINAFSTEEKFWTKTGETSTDVYRVSLFVFATEKKPELYQTEKQAGNPKSKVLAALRFLAAKYARELL